MDDENEVRNPLLHVCAKGRIHMKGSMPDSLMYRYLKAFWRSERSLFPANRSSGSSLGITINDAGELQPPTEELKKSKKKKKKRRRKVPNGPPLEMAHEWVADELRPRCSVCNKKFRLVRRFKHHCRACGEVICRECTFHHRVNVRATQSFRGLRGTVAKSVDLISDAKHAKDESPPSTDFDMTMTCSFDNQVEEEESKGGEFDGSLSLVNARKAVNGPLETAVLGGDSVVCVVMAKVCLRCLQNVPIVNRAKSKSTQRRRHSEMALNGDLAITDNDGEFGLDEEFPLRPQTWTPDIREVEELDGLDDEPGQTAGGELDLPMLVDDTDAESVDGFTEMKKRPDQDRQCMCDLVRMLRNGMDKKMAAWIVMPTTNES
ncbi:Myosinlike protein [Phytophthora palmivora]|uniref:Myosinlike protein n=1 Tax=Phytophthora palmivora TaxID=4796 RepID=A0A2P4XWQ7_9STRA|nr:Myosinlike protein [Phytophthora palmivora]